MNHPQFQKCCILKVQIQKMKAFITYWKCIWNLKSYFVKCIYSRFFLTVDEPLVSSKGHYPFQIYVYLQIQEYSLSLKFKISNEVFHNPFYSSADYF